MKMEISLTAPESGTIAEIYVTPGIILEPSQNIMRIVSN